MQDAASKKPTGAESGAERAYSSMKEVEEDVNKMKDAITAAEYAGNRAEADMLKKKLAGVQRTIEQAKERAAARAREMAADQMKNDWDNPSPEMIADAKKFNLDLTDPAIRAELIRCANEQAEGKDPSVEAAKRAASGGLWSRLRSSLPLRYAAIGAAVAVVVVAWRIHHWLGVIGGPPGDPRALGAHDSGGPLGVHDARELGVMDEPWVDDADGTDDLDW